MNTLRMKTAPKIAAALAVASGLFFASSARADVLLFDDFSDGNYTSDPAWSASQGTWSVSDDAVHTGGGTSSFTFLQTKDFTNITSGVFSLSVDVQFSSLTVVGTNRIVLRMRDSQNSSAGFEVAIAQGTMNNSGISAVSGATIGTQTKTTSPYTFPLDTYVTITWERTALGAMTVHVGNQLYFSVDTSSITNFKGFDTLDIGGRTYIDATTTYGYSFTNVELSTVPEPNSVGLLLGVGGVFLMVSRRRRSRMC